MPYEDMVCPKCLTTMLAKSFTTKSANSTKTPSEKAWGQQVYFPAARKGATDPDTKDGEKINEL